MLTNDAINNNNMDDFDKNPVEYLKTRLNSKARLKQSVWKNTIKFFGALKKEAETLIAHLKNAGADQDEVRIDIQTVSDFEFHICFGSDIVVYSLQTNVVTFDASHYLMQNKYLQQSPDLAFFGQIMIYDFMADSLKFNRTQDIGYLLGRVLVNGENHFMIEGVKGLHYLFGGIDETMGLKENYSLIINKLLAAAVDSDLLAPDFSKVQFVTLGIRMKGDKELGHGNKIGFQISSNDSTEV